MITVENNIGLTIDVWNYCHNSKCIGVWLAHTGKILNARVFYRATSGKIVYERKATFAEIDATIRLANDDIDAHFSEIMRQSDTNTTDDDEIIDVVEID